MDRKLLIRTCLLALVCWLLYDVSHAAWPRLPLADETPKGLLNDPWTFGLLVTTLVGSGLSLAFSVGWNGRGLREVEKRAKEDREQAMAERKEDREESRRIQDKIFGKLDELSKGIPHVCQQQVAITELQSATKTNAAAHDSNKQYIKEIKSALERIERNKAWAGDHGEHGNTTERTDEP